MVGTDRLRFCEHCNLSVHDVSAMTRAEAESLVRASKGRLCLRFHRDEEGRVRTADAPAIVPITRRAARVAAGAMAIALVAGAAVPAARGAVPAAPAAAVRQEKEPSGGLQTTLSGVALDEQGAVIPGAAVTLTRSDTGATRRCETNDEGRYSFEAEEGTYSLYFESPGFRRTSIADIIVLAGELSQVDVTLVVAESEATMGVLMISSPAEDLVSHAAEREPKGDGESRLPPVIHALYEGGADSIKEAIRDGGDVNARGTFGVTALMTEVGDRDHVKALLAAGAEVNARDDFGVTALMNAGLYDDPKVVKMLVAAGADVDAVDSGGLTALMAAAFDGNEATVKALLRAGAFVHARDSRGKTALGYAREAENEEVIKVLEAAGASE